VSEELPSPLLAVALLLVSAPFLVLALRAAARMLPRRPAPPFRWTPAEGLAIVATPFVAAVALQALFAGAAAPVAPDGTPDGASEGATVLLQLVANQLVLGSAAVLAIFIAARRAGGLAVLGLTVGAPLRAYLAVPLAFVPLFVCGTALATLWMHLSRALGWPVQQEVMQMILGLEEAELAVAVFLAVAVAPLVEELLFRGFLLSFLVQVCGRRAGFVLAALLFALLHGTAGLPMLIGLSLFLCWLQARTRSLWPSVAAHALNNAVSLGLVLTALAQ
jgi:membrane protease YdiL (CAAX protease family)